MPRRVRNAVDETRYAWAFAYGRVPFEFRSSRLAVNPFGRPKLVTARADPRGPGQELCPCGSSSRHDPMHCLGRTADFNERRNHENHATKLETFNRRLFP